MAGRNRRLGTTSACAENTVTDSRGYPWHWNYLRVRGEYPRSQLTPAATWELPPRARRIHSRGVRHPGAIGTTSACAENTFSNLCTEIAQRNYLRVRGEYPSTISRTFWITELPPRARRIPKSSESSNHSSGNYLRVRGEYFSPRVWSSQRAELPPRARRIPSPSLCVMMLHGTTSACAENTRRLRGQ